MYFLDRYDGEPTDWASRLNRARPRKSFHIIYQQQY